MTRRVVFHVHAAAELEAAAAWYEEQRQGLGLQFLTDVDRTVQHARTWPATGAPIEHPAAGATVRRLAVDRFPYHLAYLVHDDTVHVLAVAHDRRRPGYWKGRRSAD